MTPHQLSLHRLWPAGRTDAVLNGYFRTANLLQLVGPRCDSKVATAPWGRVADLRCRIADIGQQQQLLQPGLSVAPITSFDQLQTALTAKDPAARAAAQLAAAQLFQDAERIVAVDPGRQCTKLVIVTKQGGSFVLDLPHGPSALLTARRQPRSPEHKAARSGCRLPRDQRACKRSTGNRVPAAPHVHEQQQQQQQPKQHRSRRRRRGQQCGRWAQRCRMTEHAAAQRQACEVGPCCLPACSPAHLPARPPACPPARPPACPPARLPACPPARLPACPPARLPACPPWQPSMPPLIGCRRIRPNPTTPLPLQGCQREMEATAAVRARANAQCLEKAFLRFEREACSRWQALALMYPDARQQALQQLMRGALAAERAELPAAAPHNLDRTLAQLPAARRLVVLCGNCCWQDPQGQQHTYCSPGCQGASSARVMQVGGGTQTSAPCALRPAPCALRPAPCALRPAPCALRPAPRTQRPAPSAPHSPFLLLSPPLLLAPCSTSCRPWRRRAAPCWA